MSYYETPKPQSILHQIGRLGSKIASPLTKSKKKSAGKKNKQEDSSPSLEGVCTENGIILEHDDSGRDDFSSVSGDEYEENVIDESDLLPPPQATPKCDGNSQDGKTMLKVFPSGDLNEDGSSSKLDDQRRKNSRRKSIDNTGLVV